MNKKDEEIQKLKDEFQQFKEANSMQFGGAMLQMCWQMGEKFGKMENKIDGLKSANCVEIGAFEELKEQFGKMAGENAELKEKMAKMNEEFVGKTAKIDEMEIKMNEIEAKNAELKGRIVEKDEEMGKMKAEMVKMKTAFGGKMVEFETKLPESLEQKANKEMLANLTGGINGMEFVQMKNNKWNAADCGPKLVISEGGLIVKHSAGQNVWNCIRAISPIPPFNLNSTNPSLAGYFEAQIIRGWIIHIGFCTQRFKLERNWLGNAKNSIGICRKAGMHIDGQFNKFGNNADGYFNARDLIGVGIIYFPANKSMKCFAILNGQLLGTIELPSHFASIQLFPAATFYYAGESIRTNFGAEK